jgi:hypothetical protein
VPVLRRKLSLRNLPSSSVDFLRRLKFWDFSCLGFLQAKMITSMRVEDRLDGADNFRSWKHKILLILEENELLDHVNQVLLEP